jgi:hypothetical protein
MWLSTKNSSAKETAQGQSTVANFTGTQHAGYPSVIQPKFNTHLLRLKLI